MTLFNARFPLGVLLAVLGLSAGCRRQEVSHFTVTKGQDEPASLAAIARVATPAPEAAAATDQPALGWTLPAGWTEAHPGGMRYATLKTTAAGKIDASVVVLPGPAGGELANVNRWRGQIGLPPLDETALAAARQTLATKAGAVSVYDFTSEGAKKSRVIAALASADGNSWFLKLVGDAAPVAQARADFLQLLRSLHTHAAN